MNKESEKALQQLTGKSGSDVVPVEELQRLADDYPYFAAAQLLLLQKMKQVQHADLPKQLRKTALYFPDELWLRYLLSENGDRRKETTKAASEQPDEIINNPVADAEPVAGSEEQKDDVTEPVTEADSIETEDVSAAMQETEDANLITLPAEEILDSIPATGYTDMEPEEMPLDEEETRDQAEELPANESNQKIASLLSQQAEQFHKPVADDAKLPISTEPFHTVDYFASQGIKLDPKRDENVFDKKVHKFTDWLRQMKRINPQPSDLGTEAEEEKYVVNIADSSNYTKKVLTESMAEVLVKQGKPDKAVEIYQKLSLLNPDKSTYFAALIQNLK